LEILLECAERLSSKTYITFVLCGEGAARRELEIRARALVNVRFLGLQPEARLNELVNLADIHVLPQLAGAADLVMPSKLTGMLASGRAVVACAESGTELGRVVGACGRIVPPGDVSALAQTILELAHDERLRAVLGERGRDYAVQHLDRNKILADFASTLRKYTG